MAQEKRHSGVLSPVLTPFNEDLSPNAELLIRQCRWLISNNVGLAFFGTNSEANSLVAQKPFLSALHCNLGIMCFEMRL